MITIAGLINLLIYLIVIAILGGLVIWVVDNVPIPPPFNRFIKIAVVVILILIVVLLLLNLAGVATVAPIAVQ